MKPLLLFLILFFLQSCIPVKVAPHIETDKVMVAKKFKRKLPNQNAFIFEDPKDANEFYTYIDTKFELNGENVEFNVPFKIDGDEFYFSFLEVQRETKTLNPVPFLIDAKREQNGNDPLLEEHHTSRVGQWYLLITVLDDNFNDCLKPNYSKRESILKYLRELKTEYLNTSNYLDVLFKK